MVKYLSDSRIKKYRKYRQHNDKLSHVVYFVKMISFEILPSAIL